MRKKIDVRGDKTFSSGLLCRIEKGRSEGGDGHYVNVGPLGSVHVTGPGTRELNLK